jgi:transposase InsO family protein
MGKMFLIIIDAHSKWLDVHCVNTATTEITIAKLRSTFATHSLPEMIVSDNGTVFTSQEFKIFIQRNGIRHVTSALYHPSSNGLAERAVQSFKQKV